MKLFVSFRFRVWWVLSSVNECFWLFKVGPIITPCETTCILAPSATFTMLLRKQGRGVPHPGPTIMLKLYFPHHRLTFCTVWDLFRGNHLTFDRDGGRRGGIGYFFYVYPADWSWREKILERKYLAKKIPEKCFMAYNSGKKSYPCCMSRKKSITYQRFGGQNLTQAKSSIPTQKSNGRPLITLAMAYI